MISKRDLQLGKIALRAGMVTKEQLAKSLAIQKKLEKPVGLGAIFLKKGYISREQLEEIVKLHNEKDKNGTSATGEKKKKKKKKKKDKDGKDKASTADANGSEASSASEVKSDAASTNGSEAAAASAPSSEEEKKPEEAKKDEKKSTSKAQPALKKSGTAAASDSSVSSGASHSDIDTALLESAPSDAGPIDPDDPERRVITCQKCSKKYRIKKKQAGKRFACRKCKTKIKIAKDLFDKPAAGSQSTAKNKDKGSAKNAAVAVEEFSLGSGSSVEEKDPKEKKADKADKADKPEKADKADEGSTSKKPSGATKKQSGATALPKKPGSTSAAKEGGYGDLVKAAQEKKVTPLGPKTTKGQRIFGYIQAAVFLGVVAGIAGGIWYWKHMEAEARADQIRKGIEGEWLNVSAPYNAAVDAAKKAIADAKAALALDVAPPQEVLRDLTSTSTGLEKAITGLRPSDANQQVIQAPANIEKARKLIAESTPDELLRTIYLMRGRVHMVTGGESHILEAVRDFNEIVLKDPKADEALALLGQAELKRRNYPAAIDALRKSVGAKNDPKTHVYLALALEAGDICKEAVKEYEALADKDPLALVFKARALLADGDADGAIGALDAAKVEGEGLAASHARRGQALEKKGDLDGATKAFEAAGAASGKSGRGHIARGEFLLRVGRFEEAGAAFDAALKESGGARAALGLGESKAAVLDGESARRSYIQAGSLPVVSSSARLLGEIDAFDDPRGADPRATAQRRTGDLTLATGKPGDARGFYYAAAGIDPFDPESHSAIAQLEMSVKNLALAETQVKLTRNLLHSARDHDAKVEAAPVRGTAAARCLLVEAAFWDAKGDLNAAEKAIDAALIADPVVAGSPAFALKGAVLQRKGDRERAKHEYEKALDLETEGKDASARFYKEAEEALKRVAKDPLALGKARTALDVVLTMSPRHAHALCLRARVFAIEKKWEEAIKSYTASIDANIYFKDAYLARGFFYVRDCEARGEGFNDEASKDFEQAITLDPNNAQAFYGRALTRNAHNDVQPTIDDLTMVIKLDGEFAEAYKLRAEVYRKAKKDKEADADMKKHEELLKRGAKK